MRKERTLIGVIGTEMQSVEQQRILNGILAQAKAESADIIVLSNLFNPLEPENADCPENRIFSLLLSTDLKALIVLSESLVNIRLRKIILELLLQRTEIPILLVGAVLPDFAFPCISTSDSNDIEQITDHLIEEHDFHNIALLTGPLSLEASQVRIEGFRRSLEKHGIPFDSGKVFEGDFWYTSGEKLAAEWLSGEQPMPEALVCANDYMAFGVLDAFENAGLQISEQVALIGYEFIPERNLHTPLLTTYQRNRTELGRAAVQRLMQTLRGKALDAFVPPQGKLIYGVTCTCDVSRIRQHEELAAARLDKQYADWILKSELDRLLTECSSMDELAGFLGQFMFLLHGVSDVLLCLFEDWHRPAPSSDILICRSVNPWADQSEFRLNKESLAEITGRIDQSAVYYWQPLCFHDRLFGYCIMRYDNEICYDNVCRSWIKSAANGLEFLRLKADVQYLMQCRVLSDAYDSMTGMFSKNGLKNAFHMLQSTCTDGIAALLLRCTPIRDSFSPEDDAKASVTKLLTAAGILRKFHGGICGRISEYAYLLLMSGNDQSPLLMQAAAEAELLRVLQNDQFHAVSALFSSDIQMDTMLDNLSESADQADARRRKCQLLPHYAALLKTRNAVYQDCADIQSFEQTAASLGFNPDYFNRKYKEYFGISFHQDCIRSRVLFAVYLLLETNLTITETAERCGYAESKYFIRQFSSYIGCPPKAFRNAASGFFDAESES